MATFVEYPGQTGAQTDYVIPFEFIDPQDIQAEVNTVNLDPNLYSVSGSTLTFFNAPVGDVVIRRITDVSTKKVTFPKSSPIRSAALNLQYDQLLLALQELQENLGNIGAAIGGYPSDLSSQFQHYLEDAVENSTVISNLLSDVSANTSGIAQEITDRVAAITAEASARSTAIADEIAARTAAIADLQSQLDADVANLTQEISDRQTAVQGNADALQTEVDNRIAAVAAEAASRSAAIAAEAQARTDALIAEAAARGELKRSLDSLYAETSAALAAIVAEMEVRATEDEALATVTELLAVQIDDANASILAEQSARVSAIAAEADARVQAIAAEAALRASDVAALASDITQVRTDFGNADAAITTNLNALTSDHLALAQQVDTLEATFISGDFTAAIGAESSARASADAALAELIDQIRAENEENLSLAFSAVSALVTNDESTSRRIDSFQSNFNDNVARIDTELSTLASDITTNATSIASLSTSLGTAQADIVSNQTAISDEAAARASDVASLQTQIDGNASSITLVNETLTTSIDALSRRQEAFTADFAGSLALVLAEIETRATETEAASNRLTVVEAATEDNSAAIVAEQAARTTAVDAVASDVTALTTRVDTAEADIVTTNTALSAGDAANATAITALDGRVGTAESQIVTLQEADVTATAALAREASSIRSEFSAAFAAIFSEIETRADQNETTVSLIEALTVRMTDAEAEIVSEQSARVTGDQANADSIAAVSASLGTTDATLASLQSAQSNFQSATTRDLQFQLASLAGVLAGALAEIETRATENEAVVTSVDELSVNLTDNYATITEVAAVEVKADNAQTSADGAQSTADNALTRASAMYGIRLDVNGLVSGFGLSNDGAESEFAIVTDRFLIAQPGETPGQASPLFAIDGGNVLIASAFIGNLNTDVITTGEFGADRLAANAVEARHIKAEETWTSKLYLGNGDLTLDGSTGTVRYSNGGNTLVEIGALTAGGAGFGVYDTSGTPVIQARSDGFVEIDGAFIKAASIGAAEIGDATITRLKLASGAVGTVSLDSSAPSSHLFHTTAATETSAGFTDLTLIGDDYLPVEPGDIAQVRASHAIESRYGAYDFLFWRTRISISIEHANGQFSSYSPQGFLRNYQQGFHENTGQYEIAGDDYIFSVGQDHTIAFKLPSAFTSTPWISATGSSPAIAIRASVVFEPAPKGPDSKAAFGRPVVNWETYRAQTKLLSPELELTVFPG